MTKIMVICAILLGLSACGTADPNARDNRPVAIAANPGFPEYGVVQSIELAQPGDGRIGMNSVAGNIYRFSVRMDNGIFRSLLQADNGSIRVGDLVRIENGMLMR